MEAIKIIDRLSSELKELSPLKREFQHKLDKKFRLEFNYNSNHLEGNTLTYGETELLLIFDKATGKHELRELEEMKAHDVAYEMVREWATDEERPLNETTIKNLNEVLLVRPFWKDATTPDGQPTRRLIKVGDYKEYPNSVRLQNGEIFYYASPEETAMLMGDLVEWYRIEEENKTLHPVELAALLHYKFVRIHPFDDGNGRISRMLMNYVLLKHQLPPVIIKSAKKKDYLFALNQADAGDAQAFVKYIAEQLQWSLELSIKAANGESLEEEDDLEKEIAIWKRNFKKQPDTVLKKNEILFERFYDSIKPLFESFIEKHRQFSELFSETLVLFFINRDKKYADLGSLGLAIHDFEVQHERWLKGQEINEVRISDLETTIWFGSFKKAEANTFNNPTGIVCKFNEAEWIITSGHIKLRKHYNQMLTEKEIQDFVRDSVKESFASIQEKVKANS